MTKWIIGAVVVVAVAAGAWWYLKPAASPAPVETGQAGAEVPDTSDQSLAQDLADIDVQTAAFVTATSTDGLPAQIAQATRVADMWAGLSIKLTMRAGTAASSTQAALAPVLSDLAQKIADAHTQASAALAHLAISASASSTAATVTAELKKTKADMTVAGEDFAAARRSAVVIMSTLNIGASASSTTSL